MTLGMSTDSVTRTGIPATGFAGLPHPFSTGHARFPVEPCEWTLRIVQLLLADAGMALFNCWDWGRLLSVND